MPSIGTPEEAIRSLYARILDAWNRRDAGLMARQFAADGNIVGFDGSQVDSRAAIEGHLRPVFADHPTPAYVAKVREVRMIADGVGILRAVAGMIPSGSHDINAALNTVHTVIAVHDPQSDEWLAALFQSTPAAWHGRPDESAALTAELRNALRGGMTVQ